MKPGSHSPINYRTDIDGLRAVAVLSVVAFHSAPRLAPGGYVGVDVFFVISGFLISSIIIAGIQNGTFTYGGFYSRRVCRLLPALTIVLAATMGLGWLALLPDEFTQLSKHVTAGALFYSNILLWRETGYFDAAAEAKPLLHLWSLGVEEQFYIIWPLLVGFLWRFRHRGRLSALILLGVASFVLNVLLTTFSPSAAFYLAFPRFWELTIGTVLAAVTLNAGGGVCAPQWAALSRLHRFRDLASVIGLATVVGAAFALDTNVPFPGWVVLFPTFGTALIIAAGQDAVVNRIILSNRSMVFIGLISYPLYLWHWPLLSFARFVLDNGSAPDRIIRLTIVALSGVLAYMTYRYCELPLRTSGDPKRTAWVSSWSLAAVCAFAVVVVPRTLPRINDSVSVAAMTASGDWAFPRSASNIVVPTRSSGPSVAFIGDSQMEQYYPAVMAAAAMMSAPPQVVFATKPGCPFLPGVDRLERGYWCPDHYRAEIALAKSARVRRVVIASYWQAYVDGTERSGGTDLNYAGRRSTRADVERAFARLASDLADLRVFGKDVVLIGPHPTGPSLDPLLLVKQARIPFFGSIPSKQYFAPLRLSDFKARVSWIDDQLRGVADQAHATYIDPTLYLCAADLCSARDGDTPRYKDAAHLRPFAVLKYLTFVSALVS